MKLAVHNLTGEKVLYVMRFKKCLVPSDLFLYHVMSYVHYIFKDI